MIDSPSTASVKKPLLLRTIFKGWAIPIIIGVVIAKILTTWVFSGAEVVSGSMVPTLPYPAYLLVDRLATEIQAPYRGEVIMFHHPKDSVPAWEDPLLKRIIGLPGDTVLIKNGHVYIDGKPLNEPYVKFPDTTQTFGPYHVPKGEYFVMGDYRINSFDSRYWQNPYVPRANIIGRIDMVVWPLKDFHFVH